MALTLLACCMQVCKPFRHHVSGTMLVRTVVHNASSCCALWWRYNLHQSVGLTPGFEAVAVQAAALALEHGWAINLGGGMHHARFDNGEGWCACVDRREGSMVAVSSP